MIAVDTSALMAIVLDEPQAEACMAALVTRAPARRLADAYAHWGKDIHPAALTFR